ncbi:hypothetical protein bcgnr5380_12900 [Bacillus cereus]
MRRASRWNWIYLKVEATQLLPSLKHKIPCFLAGDFIIVILPSSLLK